jgi:hypothetical protein
MTTEDIWPAVQALAATWSNSPLIETLVSRHPARTDSNDAVTEALKNLQAGTNALTEAPLLTMVWEQLAQQMPLVQLTDELRSYLRQVAPLGQAVGLTVGWVRSRLPLYPKIPVPQFSPRGFRRSPEFSFRVPWAQEFLSAGLQDEPTPPNVARILRVGEQEMQTSAQNVLAAFIGSSEWQQYANLAASLTDHDRELLDASRHRVGVLLNPRILDEYEDARTERRNAFRRERVAEVVGELKGRPKELADAFDIIDDLIDHALINVHGQLTIRGLPPLIDPIDLDLDGPRAAFDYEGDAVFGVGESVRLNDSLAMGAYRIDGMSFNFGQIEGSRMSFTAEGLPGTQMAFQSH